jgi:hypothetical protein
VAEDLVHRPFCRWTRQTGDAAAVGGTLAFVIVNIITVALAIGAAIFTLATGGLLLGKTFGARFSPIVEFLGGRGLVAKRPSVRLCALA